MLLDADCLGGDLWMFIDLLCVLLVAWLFCFICCGWVVVMFGCGRGVVVVVTGVVGVYLVGIVVGGFAGWVLACDLVVVVFVNSVVVMHYTFVYLLLCGDLLRCGWGLRFMFAFMLCLFVVHSLCRFGCWCYCAWWACYVCLLVCVCCG